MYSADKLHKAAEALCEKLYSVFKKNGVRKAILFGSYAAGSQTSASDIDILVDSGLRGLKFYGLLEDVCNSVGRPVDLIDISQLEPNSEIAGEIEKTGVLIYEQPRYKGYQNNN